MALASSATTRPNGPAGLTLNPIPHIDPFGTIILPALLALSGAGVIGWAKPVPVNVSRLRHPRNEGVVVSLIGPAVNIALAVIFGLTWRYLLPIQDKLYTSYTAQLPGPVWAQYIFVLGYINVLLAVFNLIPLPPLDGSAVLERLLPQSLLPGYYRIRPFTMFIPLAIVLLFPSVLDHIFQPALNEWFRLLAIGDRGLVAGPCRRFRLEQLAGVLADDPEVLVEEPGDYRFIDYFTDGGDQIVNR